MHRLRHAGAVLGIALASAPALAQPIAPEPEPTDGGGETIEVSSEAPAESASSVHLSSDMLRYRAKTQPSDLLRQIPGLVVSQHAGGGKSDQYFIRGFDADHGTDVAIFADGIPVNLTSHGHGQGYADTHWMIPETIASVDMHKGPYAARYGDFYTAGALELKTIDSIEGNTVWIAAGGPLASTKKLQQYDTRLVGMASPALRDNADDKSLVAMQIAQNDGPFLSQQDFRQGNALVKWSGKLGPGRLQLQGTWYAGRWNQSGQVPEQEVEAGRLDRFGAIDPSEGGTATRSSAQLGYTVHDAEARSTWHVRGYGVANRLRLFSNFTLFARDPMNGDEIEQTDARLLYGLDAGYERWLTFGKLQALVTAGVQVRADDVETSLWQASQRSRLAECFAEGANPCNHTNNRIRAVSAYAEVNVIPTERLHILPGIRVDRLTWDVDDLDQETMLDPMTTTGGSAQRTIASPKLSAVFDATERVAVFANSGVGFHSNDARAAVATAGRGALARAYGAETGVRVKPLDKARVSADVWYLRLTSEQVWSGDAGGTEPSDPTRRYGVDVEGAIDPLPWLSIDANLTWARSTLVANQGNGGALALAPKFMGSGGVAVHDKLGFVSLRARGIGDRPGNDDGSLTAEGYLIFDVIAGRRLSKHFNLELTIANLLDTEWREAQFAEESRVSPTAELVEQMHFTPGVPLTATLKLSATL